MYTLLSKLFREEAFITIIIISLQVSSLKAEPFKDISQIQALAQELSITHELPWELVYALIQVESKWDTSAVSDKSCYGLMQIRASIHAQGIESEKLFNPELNLSIGLPFLKMLLTKHAPDTVRALAFYNAGYRWQRGVGYAKRVLREKENFLLTRSNKVYGSSMLLSGRPSN